jgi:uncharacterized protein (TIGR00369 family)
MKTVSLTKEERIKIENNWNNHITVKSLGVKIDLSNDDFIKIVLDNPKPVHRGGIGTDAINGGILSALFDLSVGLIAIVNSENHRVATIQLNINFLKPVKGNFLVVQARLIKKGKNLIFGRAEIFDEKGDLCAYCDGISGLDKSKPKVQEVLSDDNIVLYV